MISHSKPCLCDREEIALKEILDKGLIANGEKALVFTDKLKTYFPVKDCTLTASGTSSLIIALQNIGVTFHDEVILPTYVCESAMLAVSAVGAVPVLCDIGEGWNVTSEEIKPKISEKTKAVIVPHIFGIAADIEDINKLGVPVIEDCAQAFGLEINGKKAGTIGDYGILSFNATKCLATGEGGAVISKNRSISATPSANLSDLQAALGLSQLERYDYFLQRRRDIANKYFQNIKNELTVNLKEFIELSIFFRFPLTVINMDFELLKQEFEGKGIAVRRGVDKLLHRSKKLPDAEFPNAVKRFNETLSIPIYPALSDNELEIVLSSVKSILS